VSYLHPAYYRLLPATARPQLIAYLQLVERNVHASSDGWTDMRQGAIAEELGRSARSVRLYEQVCRQAGILVVEHHKRSNRRRLTMRSAKEALAVNPNPRQVPIRECGNALPNSAATGCRSVSKSHLLPRARSDRGDLLRSQTPKPAPPADRASPSRRETQTRTRIPESVLKRTTALVTPMGGRWAPKVAELVFALVRSQGERQTLGFLDIVEQRVDGQVQPYARAKAALAMLTARLRKLREHAGPRSGPPRNAVPARLGA